tara:strand:+ start:192 stop:326 length:135 start_codon:yes stop_codon:yes gene_type:complete
MTDPFNFPLFQKQKKMFPLLLCDVMFKDRAYIIFAICKQDKALI